MAKPAYKGFIAIIAAFLTFSLIQVIGQEYSFRHLNSEHGLSSNEINVIFKDAKGFIWIGTNDGLNRYDGINNKIFKHNPNDPASVSDNSIQAIIEETNGNLLIGTATGGLNRFNYPLEKFTRIEIKTGVSENAGFNRVNEIKPDSAAVYWIGTDGGLVKYFSSKGIFLNYLPEPENLADSSNRVVAIFKEFPDRIWVGTLDGLYHFDPLNGSFSKVSLIPDWYFYLPWEKIIRCIYQDSKDVIWIGTQWFLFRFENGFIKWIGPPGYTVVDSAPNSNAINSIDEQIIDGKQTLWMATWGGVNRYDPQKQIFYNIFTETNNPRGLSSYSLSTQLLDDKGILWIGHDDKGVDMLNLNSNRFERPAIDTAGSNLSALSFLFDSKGNFWAGMDDHGLLQMDEDMNFSSFIKFRLPGGEELQNCDISCIFQDSKGTIWMGNEVLAEGLFIFDPVQRLFEPVNLNIPDPYFKYAGRPVFFNSIIEDKYGAIWIGTSHGLYRNNLERSGEITLVYLSLKDSLVPVYIYCLAEDRQGNFWIATRDQGLYCIKSEHNDIRNQPFLYPDQLKQFDFPGSIYKICEDHAGNIWLGASSGLFRINVNENTIVSVSDPSGLITGNPVYGIIEDNNHYLWLNSKAGLIRFNPDSNNKVLTRKFDRSDGLPFDRFNTRAFYLSGDGRIFAGGMQATGDGFFFFHPEEIRDNTCIPKIIITDFKVRNEEFRTDSGIVSKKHLRLKYDQNFFSFEFAALDYIYPVKNRFAYFLEGLEDDWVYSGNRRYVSYSSVPPGNYIFRVKGSNNDGYWNETGTSLAITILPPPWRTWWAYCLYGIGILGLITAWRSYDLKRQRLKHQLALEHIESEKLKVLDITKSRFFANISHEFRTPLTLILGPLDILREIVPKEAQRDLEIMQHNARRLQNLINQLLMLSKIESGQVKLKTCERNIVKLISGYILSFESLAKQKNIDFVFNSHEKEMMVYIDRDKLEKILYNLLSNAFKFTPVGGRIEVKVIGQRSLVVSHLPLDNRQLTNDQLPTTKDLRTNHIAISISDTGPGISPEHLPHIFDRFYQADDSSTRLQEGTGIGLALTREMVELHHGRIFVDSETGSGTRFTVVLPMGSAHLKPGEIASEEDQAGAEENNSEIVQSDWVLDKMSDEKKKPLPAIFGRGLEKAAVPVIMVVEDNADLREYIGGFLAGSYQLVEAGDGEEGWQVATEKIPDLVISDVMMPKMDGFELCHKLKHDERTSHIPVILLTARASTESKLEGLETGADDFITKPFDPLELQIRVKNLLAQRKKLKDRFMRQAGKAGMNLLVNLTGEETLSMDEKFMQKAVRIISEKMGDPEFNIGEFASKMAMSHMQLHRKLVALTGQPANRLIRTVRLVKAAQLIKNKSGNITEIAYEVGFNNLSWFARCFHEQFGKSPSEYSSHPDTW